MTDLNPIYPSLSSGDIFMPCSECYCVIMYTESAHRVLLCNNVHCVYTLSKKVDQGYQDAFLSFH